MVYSNLLNNRIHIHLFIFLMVACHFKLINAIKGPAFPGYNPTVGLFIHPPDRNGPAHMGYLQGFKSATPPSVVQSAGGGGQQVAWNWTVVEVHMTSSLELTKKTCQLLRAGVYGFFTTFDNAFLTSVSSTFDIPLFTSRRSTYSNGGTIGYDPAFASASTTTSTTTTSSPNSAYPVQSTFTFSSSMGINHWNKFLIDFLDYLHIDTIALLYQDEEGLRRLSHILNEPKTLTTLATIFVRRLRPDLDVQSATADALTDAEAHPHESHNVSSSNINTSQPNSPTISILQEIRKRVKTLFVDCDLETVIPLLRAIQDQGMNDHHVVFTNLDAKQLDLKKFTNLNLTFVGLSNSSIMSEQGFASDNVEAFSHGLHAYDPFLLLPAGNLSCDASLPWAAGLTLVNYISSVNFQGVTGQVKFREGERVGLSLDVLRMSADGLLTVGMWSSESGLNMTKPFSVNVSANVTLVVTTVLEMPYVQMRLNQSGNARFEGFSVDLLKLIAHQVGFKFVIEYDKKYGAYDPETGEWNGVVRQLLDKKADLGIGSMTINHARLSVIDFTKPFMHLGISILFKVPKRPSAKLFSFLKPLAVEIWFSILISYCFVSITMFIVSRFSCEEGKHFGLANAFWYPIGTLMQQGSDLNPRRISTRLVAGFWWFFSLVMISSYTANLAAFLTVERMTTPIESAEDLAEQSEIAYGTLESGSTMSFFRDSKMETYQRMWRFMESRKPSVFVSTYEEGIQRVLDEDNYAFLMESTMLDYIVQQNCNLTQIGGLLDSKGYGIATPIGSPWRDKISLAILEMTEKGIIQSLYNKWWKSTSLNGCSADLRNAAKAAALGVDSIGGVFIVLSTGLCVAICIAIFEFCCHNKGESISVCSEMAKECRFAIRCVGPRRRPALIRHCENCSLYHDKMGGIDGHHHRPYTPPPCHDYHTYPHRHRQSLQAHFNLNGI